MSAFRYAKSGLLLFWRANSKIDGIMGVPWSLRRTLGMNFTPS